MSHNSTGIFLTTVCVDTYMYTNGSAGTNSTYDANLKEFKKWAIVPRMLRDNTLRNLEVCCQCLSLSLYNNLVDDIGKSLRKNV